MESDNTIERSLHRIHRYRNRIGYSPHLIAYFLSVYFQREELLLDARWYVVAGLMLSGTILRAITGEVFFEAWDKNNVWATSLHRLSFLILGLAWGLHFSDVFYHYGAESPHVTYTLLVIVAFITGASTSMVAQKDCYYLFIISIALCVVATYLADWNWSYTYIVLNVLLYLFFSVINFRFSYNQLINLLELKNKTKLEKERFKNLINTVPGFVGLIDQNLICYLANRATLSVFPDIVGKKLGNQDPNSQWENHVLEFMNSDRTEEIFEEKTVFNGKDVFAILNIQRTVDGGAIIVSIITTELVQARKKIREQEAKAQYSAKLASLGEMAAGIAHEVNNPLTIIQGSASIIKRLVDEEPLDRENLRILSTKVVDTTERISKTVKSLKSLSRNGERDPKVEISIEQIIDISVELCQQRTRLSGIELKLPSVMPDAIVIGREVQLSQVFVNLLGNSIDAVKKLEKKWIEIKMSVEHSFIDIYVIDSGNGIPKEIQSRMMEPFFTTKDVNQGTGLGLSISKTIIHDHGGELSLVTDGAHTTFRIRLPIKKKTFPEVTDVAPE